MYLGVHTLLRAFLTGCLTLLGFAGCGKEAPASLTTNQSGAPFRTITVLGDETRFELVRALGGVSEANAPASSDDMVLTRSINGRSVRITTSRDSTPAAKARFAGVADMALLAVDATKGPLPVHREDVLLARQMGVAQIVIVLTHADRIDDPELLDLEELEMRELLNRYRMDGDRALCLVDVASAPKGKLKRGHATLAELLLRLDATASRAAPPKLESAPAVTAFFYVLTSEELFLRGVRQPPTAGRYKVLLSDEQVDGTISFDGQVDFGSNAEGQIRWLVPTKTFEGQRFAVLRDGHIVAAGVVKSLLNN